MKDNKKVTAVIAAVTYYMQMEEEAALMQQSTMGGMPSVLSSASAPATRISPWSMTGRQTQMQMRNLMQMRTFR